MPVPRGYSANLELSRRAVAARRGDPRANLSARGNREPGIEAPNELYELKRELKA